MHVVFPQAGRMGNQTKALDVIMEELGDVNQAIEFCKEQNDEELWEDLISHSVKQPRELDVSRFITSRFVIVVAAISIPVAVL